jgi:hypothetical protein
LSIYIAKLKEGLYAQYKVWKAVSLANSTKSSNW